MNIIQPVNAWLIVKRNKVKSNSMIQLMNEKGNCYLSFNLIYISSKEKPMHCLVALLHAP